MSLQKYTLPYVVIENLLQLGRSKYSTTINSTVKIIFVEDLQQL